MSEPSYEALEQLRTMLLQRGAMLGDTREVEGQPWVLMSPELMMQLIRDKERAEEGLVEQVRALVAAVAGETCFTCVHNGCDCTRGPFSWMDDLDTLKYCSEWEARP
jgi:hypothetical protein